MSTIGERLREERDRLGLSQTAFAELGGAGKHSQINYEADRRKPDATYLAALAQAGADITYILTGHRVPQIVKQITETFGPLLAKSENIESRFVEDIAVNPADYARIPLHEAWLSAGPGIDNFGSNIIDHLAFRRDWLARMGISAFQSCLARVSGDSMFPTLSPGDMVLLDPAAPPPAIRKRTAKDTRPATIWAILDNGEARIKRIERPADDAMVILSDNPEFMPEWRMGAQAAAVKLIGKVVWWGHTAR